MRVIEGEDVNELYWRGMNMLRTDGRDEASRVGPVRVMPEPVTSVYRKPTQRVLIDFRRAANPFFHLFESLWMLAGRNDVLALNRYIRDFGTRFAEADGAIHGAYGHRWRKALGFDQLNEIVRRLKANPRDRQAVLQMWDANPGRAVTNGGEANLPNDLLGDWKDRPCNTHVYFRIRDEVSSDGLVGRFSTDNGLWPYLDMMVSCRSNDIVLGAYGANAVHFSILQEYMAGRIGCLVGKMTQVSWNYHAYHDVLQRVGFPSNLETYGQRNMAPSPMGTIWDAWDGDLEYFMSWHRTLVEAGVTDPGQYKNSWFSTTAEPMFLAHFKFRNAMHKDARNMAMMIEAEDWRVACLQWFDYHSNPRSR